MTMIAVTNLRPFLAAVKTLCEDRRGGYEGDACLDTNRAGGHL